MIKINHMRTVSTIWITMQYPLSLLTFPFHFSGFYHSHFLKRRRRKFFFFLKRRKNKVDDNRTILIHTRGKKKKKKNLGKYRYQWADYPKLMSLERISCIICILRTTIGILAISNTILCIFTHNNCALHKSWMRKWLPLYTEIVQLSGKVKLLF